jgi:cytochrome b
METDAFPAERPRSWDPLVRLTHWIIAAAVVLNGLLTEGGSLIHVWIGYAAFALLGLRLLWGLIGPGEARFSAFPPSLSAARSHLADLAAGRHRSYRSHNPLGSLMVYALWATLFVTAATGIAMESDPFPGAGDERAGAVDVWHDEKDAEDEGEGNEIFEEIHEAAADLLLILAALHVAGVAVESRLAGTNLVRPMLHGNGRP